MVGVSSENNTINSLQESVNKLLQAAKESDFLHDSIKGLRDHMKSLVSARESKNEAEEARAQSNLNETRDRLEKYKPAEEFDDSLLNESALELVQELKNTLDVNQPRDQLFANFNSFQASVTKEVSDDIRNFLQYSIEQVMYEENRKTISGEEAEHIMESLLLCKRILEDLTTRLGRMKSEFNRIYASS
eukprot:GEZU01035829.1.p1 GENE.GEZU01035829.1~~GEZU01035829.1.p1  ORF type:complete len:218 (-),score=56.38 GEZU01035829.1:189-755(-)